MNMSYIADRMQESANKCRLLDLDIAKKRIAAQHDGLEDMIIEWADEMAVLHRLTTSYSKSHRG